MRAFLVSVLRLAEIHLDAAAYRRGFRAGHEAAMVAKLGRRQLACQRKAARGRSQ